MELRKKYNVHREQTDTDAGGPLDISTDCSQGTPSQIAMATEQFHEIFEKLNSLEMKVVTFRAQGMTYAEIADRVKRDPDYVRKLMSSIRARFGNEFNGDNGAA